MNELNHFLITGNGITGTSLLAALCNAHPQVSCTWEWNFKRKLYHTWIEAREKANTIWGNKQPLEQMFNNEWDFESVAALVDDWHIINIYRKFNSYAKRFQKRMKNICHYQGEKITEAKFFWDLNHAIYEEQRERHPDKVIRLCFEDFVIAPEREARRMFDFLGADIRDEVIASAVSKAPTIINFYKKRPEILASKAWD